MQLVDAIVYIVHVTEQLFFLLLLRVDEYGVYFLVLCGLIAIA